MITPTEHHRGMVRAAQRFYELRYFRSVSRSWFAFRAGTWKP